MAQITEILPAATHASADTAPVPASLRHQISAGIQPVIPISTHPPKGGTLGRVCRLLSRGICLAAAVGAAVWLVRLRLDHVPLTLSWGAQIAVAATVLLACITLYLSERRQWTTPVRRLAVLLPQVRAGVTPIEELGHVAGNLSPLAIELQETLRELRRYKGDVSRIERDMNRRVAQRTDALERLLGSLRQQAARDALTTLYNRRMFEECLPQLMHRARADGEPLTLLMIDVDFFKQINDTLGHSAGDEFLRSLGQLIRSTVRGGDLPFRYGGDEFSIVLPSTPLSGAQPLIARLSSLADALGKTLRVPNAPRLSVGCSCLTDLPPGASATELVQAADKNLYQFKVDRKTREHLPLTRAA